MSESNGMSTVQQWRMKTENRLTTLEQENKQQTESLGRIEKSIEGLSNTITSHHEQQEERMAMGRDRMNKMTFQGWANTILAISFGFVVVWHVFDITIASAVGGTTAGIGLLLKLRQLL